MQTTCTWRRSQPQGHAQFHDPTLLCCGAHICGHWHHTGVTVSEGLLTLIGQCKTHQWGFINGLKNLNHESKKKFN